jgi:hypothetical protein
MVTVEQTIQTQFSQAHLTNLNANRFKIIEAMRLKITDRGSPEWHYLHAKFHENLPSCSEVISGGHTDRQVHRVFEKIQFLILLQ